MKKWVVSALLVCLVMTSFLSGVAVSPAMGATTTMKRNSQVSKPAQQPVHDMIVFNDYQIAGLAPGGWNWVKNDEFILPPDTPLDIDIIQTTYGSGTNVNRKEVYLDGLELTAFQSEKSAAQSALRWQVPRFTIPASQLSSGVHTLTFVVTDAKGQSSTVHVRFQVEAQNYPKIYEGEQAQGEPIPSGSTEGIYALYGSKSFASAIPGTWKLTNRKTGAEMRSVSGMVFTTGTLVGGQYGLQFIPDNSSLMPWMIEIQVGLADLYMGTDASGQKLGQNQKITATQAPSKVQLYSSVAGRWWVNGTGQTLSDSQHFEVQIPEQLAGMTITVTFEPDQETQPTMAWSKTTTSVQIQIPGAPNACDPSSAKVTMDVLMKKNEGSSFMVERENLYSSNVTVKLYQNPVHIIWLTTAADHVEFGSEADDDEGPGVWAVDNVIVDSSKLNWDHTALELSSYKPGRYKVNYYSKREPSQSWCGYVQVIEATPPISSAPVCDPADIGVTPTMTPMRWMTKNGEQIENGQKVIVNSSRDLEDLEQLMLLSSHVVHKGSKTVKLGTKKDRRYFRMPDLQWEYGKTPIGSKQGPDGGTIHSENRVEVLYNGEEVISSMEPKASADYDGADQGAESLDLKKLIEFHDKKPGVYTIKVSSTLGYRTCQIKSKRKSYEKETDMVEVEQTLTVTVEVR